MFSNISIFLCPDTLELFQVGNASDLMPITLKRKVLLGGQIKNVKFRNPPGTDPLEERFKGKVLLLSLKT